MKRSKTCLGRGLRELAKLAAEEFGRPLPGAKALIVDLQDPYEIETRPLSERLLSRKFADQKA